MPTWRPRSLPPSYWGPRQLAEIERTTSAAPARAAVGAGSSPGGRSTVDSLGRSSERVAQAAARLDQRGPRMKEQATLDGPRHRGRHVARPRRRANGQFAVTANATSLSGP